jgi:hypothetical protein
VMDACLDRAPRESQKPLLIVGVNHQIAAAI